MSEERPLFICNNCGVRFTWEQIHKIAATDRLSPVLSEEERAHVEACRHHLEVGAEIRSLSGQRALLAIIDRLSGARTSDRAPLD